MTAKEDRVSCWHSDHRVPAPWHPLPEIVKQTETPSGKWKLRYISALWSVKRQLSFSRSVNILTLLTFKYWLVKLYQSFDFFPQDCVYSLHGCWPVLRFGSSGHCSGLPGDETVTARGDVWQCTPVSGLPTPMTQSSWLLGWLFRNLRQRSMLFWKHHSTTVEPGFISDCLVSLCLFSWGNPL